MKKKIISFVLVLVSSLVIALPCFAATVNFTDVLFSYGIWVYYNDRETLNYSREVSNDGSEMRAFTNSAGYDKFNRCTFYWRFLDASSLKADDVLQFTFTGEFTMDNEPNLSEYELGLFLTPESPVLWNPVRVGTVHVDKVAGTGVYKYTFTADFFHKFDTSLISDEEYLLFFSATGAFANGRAFASSICISDLVITNYTLGSSQNPGTPQYQNPAGSFGGFNDYEQQESEIVGGLSDGFTQFEDLTEESGFTTALNAFSTGLTAVSSGVSYLVGDSILKQILMLSLLVGSFGLILGVGSMYIRRSDYRNEPRMHYHFLAGKTSNPSSSSPSIYDSLDDLSNYSVPKLKKKE